MADRDKSNWRPLDESYKPGSYEQKSYRPGTKEQGNYRPSTSESKDDDGPPPSPVKR